MRSVCLFLFLFLFQNAYAQVISAPQQKALNACVEYANQSADEVTAVVKSLIDYYPAIHLKRSWGVPRYTCPVQLDEYYLTTAISQSKTLNATLAAALNAKLNALRDAAQKIDEKCKALDTYHKLEDYKQDNFAKAESLINDLQGLIAGYKQKQSALNAELERVYKKLNAAAPGTAYVRADAMMRQQVSSEKDLLDQWSFNLKQEVHTGWPVDKLEQSIPDTDHQLSSLKAVTPALKYPASSMWTSFQSSLASILESKRNGLDNYNFEAKKSDAHSNGVYLDLINYYNGTLVADYNTFVQFSERDGYHGLKAVKYFPLFEIRSQPEAVAVEVKPFKDIPRVPVNPVAQKTVIPKTVSEALTTYADYINETWRQTRYLQLVLNSFSSSAAYYSTIENFEKHGAMHFDFKDYHVPLSHYQKAVADSKVLLPAQAKSFNDQAEVLLNILKEMNDLAASIEREVKDRSYEKDRLKKVYQMLERQQVLFNIWDERKELFYEDVRKVAEAYVPASGSWYISGKALRQLTDLDHDALFKAKAYYKGNGDMTVPTDQIDAALRDVIAKEYDNMKGIQKIGRSNGLCPYTPYEDLPETSKSLSEQLKKLKPAKSSGYEHPYHSLVYLYNEIVDDYNKFCELSTSVYHLKTVMQPELFFVKYPTPTETAKLPAKEPVKTEAVQDKPAEIKIEPKPETNVIPPSPTHTTDVVHDTVYIEKRDTVYIAESGEDLRSMEGYASNNMVLLLDVSGSMNTPEKLPLLKTSVLAMLSMMRQEDNVSIIAFSGKPKALVEAVSFKEEEKIKKAIDNLKPSGKTDGNAGLKLAYKVADESYIRGGNNRIILATDGEFALSEETLQLIEKFSGQDIFLTIFNFGKGMGSSKNLEKLASLGKGNYEYISKENVDLKLIREAKAKRKK
jgi:Ca-activated chloride channel family protein